MCILKKFRQFTIGKNDEIISPGLQLFRIWKILIPKRRRNILYITQQSLANLKSPFVGVGVGVVVGLKSIPDFDKILTFVFFSFSNQFQKSAFLSYRLMSK